MTGTVALATPDRRLRRNVIFIYVYEDEEEKAYEKLKKASFSALKVEKDMDEEYEIAKVALEEFLEDDYDEDGKDEDEDEEE